ncbi:hypothetical protein TCAL_08207 [Tigriopus californicus]|uniref:V-type proton ATPase subunit S1/VOA1 transmembrane domain-containing protein n=1 Tax=Tigriopus californicus TaxID=6832 RepID=A0A553ND42_TIGCA|nr:uncharacterized protein LOC131888159 [Tigriopus californicus]TRY63328.1 hypothetical protein TCAL_08207 [Tigriopus californicus]|eukprot:TCALIF_08207-PA protein Name:"Similar to Atp6ap1 V-type proton ATPase subunit S1 (Mus musculus)" AED:0.00 eAED:0.00 QI:94/1/1/1/1/1/3/278/299
MKLTILGLCAAFTVTIVLGDLSFVDVESDLRWKNRNLLQEDDESPEERPERPVEPKAPQPESSFSNEPQKGPKVFYDGENFLMKVSPGIEIYVFENGNNKSSHVSKVILDKPAASVKGGFESAMKNFDVTIDFKGQTFGGEGSIQLSSVIVKMSFVKKPKEFAMTRMEISQATIGSTNVMGNELSVSSSNGYSVYAPLDSGFCCDYTGVFKPKKRGEGKYSLALGLPGLKMQVFDVKSTKFGPSWYCGELISIGLWVGLLTTLGFAIVCYWGFGMLASIQTMDRFDDPKGKPIHVPQTE